MFGVLALDSSAEDWPQWRGPDHNGISRESGWNFAWTPAGPKKVWSASVGIGFSSMAVATGRLFTLGNSNATDTVYCFDAETGAEIWKYSYPCPIDAEYYEGGPGSTPTVVGQQVFTLSKRGQVFCFEAATGKVIWQKDLMAELGVKKPRWGFAGSPLVLNDLVIVNIGGAGTALEKATGKVAWKSGTEPSGYATPIPYRSGNESSVAVFSAKALVGVRARDGQELWRHDWVTRWDINATDPIITPDGIFISSFDHGCALLQVSNGKPKTVWQNKNMANHFNSCVAVDGYLYGIHGNTDQPDRDLRCLDLKSGEVKWKYKGFGLGSVTIAGGKLIVLSDRGELTVASVSPQGFKPLAQAHVLGGKCWTVPVLANGRIYCRNAEGTLICLDVRPDKL
jgi:outer membrane protein assembly factor BamB